MILDSIATTAFHTRIKCKPFNAFYVYQFIILTQSQTAAKTSVKISSKLRGAEILG